MLLGGKDSNVLNWWCIFLNKWYQTYGSKGFFLVCSTVAT